MGTKINIMGLDIDIISIDALVSTVQEYLDNDCLNIILMANTTLLEETGKDQELKELAMEADIIIPSDETLLSLHHVDNLKIASMVVDYSCISPIFNWLGEEGKSIYIVARNEKEVSVFREFYVKPHSGIAVEGIYCDDLVHGEELLLNKINSVAPDIVLFMVDSPLQERWIMGNRTKLNSKLCFAIGAVSEKILSEQKVTPMWISKLKMETLYNWAKQNKGLKKVRAIHIFKKKVEDYKNKKLK